MKGKCIHRPKVVEFVVWEGTNRDEVVKFFRENSNNTYCGGVVGAGVEYKTMNGFERIPVGGVLVKDATGFRGLSKDDFNMEYEIVAVQCAE